MTFLTYGFTVVAAIALVAAARLARATSVMGSVLASSLILVAVQSEVVQFTYPPQAKRLLDATADPIQMLLGLDLWGPRYLLSYPGVVLRNLSGASLDRGYTIYAAALMLLWLQLAARSVLRACARFGQSGPMLRTAIVLMVALQVLAVATRMNGRLIPAFLGMALILDAQLDVRRSGAGWLARLALGVFFTMMSSGTMMVGLTQAIVGHALSALRLSPRPWRALRQIVTVGAAVSLVFAPIIGAGIEKNLQFYGGSVVAMLTHGAGQLLYVRDVGLLLISIAAISGVMLIATLLVMHLRRSWRELDSLLVALPIAAGLGLFGYSTLLMCIPALIALVTTWMVLMAQQLQVVRLHISIPKHL